MPKSAVKIPRIIKVVNPRAMVRAAAMIACTTCAFADDVTIEGTYTQNELCRGNGSQQEPLRVQMGASEISYAGGTCSIDSRQQSGPSLTMQVTCKFKSGAVLGSVVTFTRRDDNTYDMTQ